MNYRMIAKILSRVMLIEAALMLPSLLCALAYGESIACYIITAIVAVTLAGLFSTFKPKSKSIYAREGFVGVALSWILMSLVGAIPFFISGEIPSLADAIFESASGFTTTGASILTAVEEMSRGLLLWRSITQWIGGMGVLVFVMAVLPLSESNSMHIMRAEMPGPVVGKLVPRVRNSSAISYMIYVGLTLLLMIFLLFGNMSFFDALTHALSTAATGGFGIKTQSVGYYNSAYIEIVIAVFMLLYGVNFSVFFLILLGKFKTAFKNTELLCYLGVIAFSTITIALDIRGIYEATGSALRHSFFQVSSIVTTTGFSTTDFDLWPSYSKVVLLLLMLSGGCAGSTAGGIKVSRLLILSKSARAELYKLFNPRSISPVTIDGQDLDATTVRACQSFFFLYILLALVSSLVISLDGLDLLTTGTSVITCLSNVGPGLGLAGPAGGFSMFSDLSKIVLSLCMLIGRLEIYPLLMLAMPSVWRRT